MQAGRLRQRVSFLKFLETDDGHGGFTETSQSVRTRVAAAIEPLVGRDLERARQVDVRASHLLTVRWWQTSHEDLKGGRVQAIWHDGVRDRTLEVVEPPRELKHHDELAMTVKEAA